MSVIADVAPGQWWVRIRNTETGALEVIGNAGNAPGRKVRPVAQSQSGVNQAQSLPTGIRRQTNAVIIQVRQYPFQRMLTQNVGHEDRKSTRLNSSHVRISYAVFCYK